MPYVALDTPVLHVEKEVNSRYKGGIPTSVAAARIF